MFAKKKRSRPRKDSVEDFNLYVEKYPLCRPEINARCHALRVGIRRRKEELNKYRQIEAVDKVREAYEDGQLSQEMALTAGIDSFLTRQALIRTNREREKVRKWMERC